MSMMVCPNFPVDSFEIFWIHPFRRSFSFRPCLCSCSACRHLYAGCVPARSSGRKTVQREQLHLPVDHDRLAQAVVECIPGVTWCGSCYLNIMPSGMLSATTIGYWRIYMQPRKGITRHAPVKLSEVQTRLACIQVAFLSLVLLLFPRFLHPHLHILTP